MSAGQPGEADSDDGDADGDDDDDDDDDDDGVSARRTGQAQDRMAAELEGVLEHVKVGTVFTNISLCTMMLTVCYDANY